MKKELQLDEIKKIEIGILDYIVSVAEKNNITVFLDGGTLLGALRHKGFIPWDDDIDLLIPRKDYRKLLDVLEGDKRYRVLSQYNNSNYIYPFAKVVDTTTRMIEYDAKKIDELGIYVDLFPLDNLPNIKIIRTLYKKIAWRLRWIASCSANSVKKSGFLGMFVNSVVNVIGWKKALYWLDKMLSYCSKKETNYAFTITAAADQYREGRSEWFAGCRDIEFEGKQYKAPIDLESYLTMLYGNYMELPPIEKRVSNHNFIAWRINE